jgi:hypothetical protein
MHTLLVGGPCILYSKWHLHVAEASEGSDERGDGLVCLSERYLVVARVGIRKTQEFTPDSEVYDLVNSGKRERILRAFLVKACVIHIHPPFPILFWHDN